MMTPEEAREEVKKMFPNGSCCATKEAWYHHSSGSGNSEGCRLSYNFSKNSCESANGSSFEECLQKITERHKELNDLIKKYAILLRKF